MILFVEQDKFTISPTIIKSVCMCTFGTFLFDLASNSCTASHIVDFVKIEIEILPGFEKSDHSRSQKAAKMFKPNLADFAYGLKVLFHLFV